jgi:hypothetical protein
LLERHVRLPHFQKVAILRVIAKVMGEGASRPGQRSESGGKMDGEIIFLMKEIDLLYSINFKLLNPKKLIEKIVKIFLIS